MSITTPRTETPQLPGVVRYSSPKQAREHARALRDGALSRRSRPGYAPGEEAPGKAARNEVAQNGAAQHGTTPADSALTEPVCVECDDQGTPVRVQWEQRWHTVAEEPLRWFERRRWWLEEPRAALGSGAGVVDHEIWRVQLTPTCTLDLSRHTASDRWRLLRVHRTL